MATKVSRKRSAQHTEAPSNLVELTSDQQRLLDQRRRERAAMEESRNQRVGSIKRTLQLFHPAGSVVEVRLLNIRPERGRPYTAAGYFGDFGLAAKAVVDYEAKKTIEGVYFVLNECDPALLARCPNAIEAYPKATTADGDITRRRWLLIDLDPKRPAGIASTEPQLDASRETAEQVRDLLAGWSQPIQAMSGNGTHLLYPIDLPNDEASKQLVASVLKAIDAKCSTDSIKIDTAVHNAARITKLYGTLTRKGHNTTDRPHRRSELVDVPDYLASGWNQAEVVPTERLQAVAAMAPKTESHRTNGQASGNGQAGYSRLLVDRWLSDRGVSFRQSKQTADGRTMWPVVCPFDASHGERGESVVMQAPNGRMAYKCQHDSCSGHGWQDLKRAIGPPKAHHFDPPLLIGSSREPKAAAEQKPIEPGTIVYAGDRGNFGTVVADHGATCSVHFVSPDGREATKDLPKSELKTQDGKSLDPNVATDGVQIELIPSREFAEAEYHQRYLVRKILVADQPAIVGGRSKTLKTSLLVDLALGLGTGSRFLGEFQATQSTVAILSGESGQFTIQETAKRQAAAKGIDLADAAVYWGFSLPQLGRRGDLAVLGDALLANSIDVLMIDPAYLCLLAGDVQGLQSSNIFDMGPLLLQLSELGQQTNCTVVLCHHCRKNSAAEQFDPPDLEELSMAGFAEWARQWLLLGRREPYDQGSGEHRLWLNVGGSAGHSGCYALDIDEGTLNDDFTGRIWDVTVSTAMDARTEAKNQRERQRCERQAERDEEYKRRVLASLRQFPQGETATVLKGIAGLNGTNFGIGIRSLVGEGRAETCQIEKNGKQYDAFKPTGK